MQIKKIIQTMLLCIPLLLCGCNSSQSESSVSDKGGTDSSEFESTVSEGRFLKCKNDSYMIIIENNGPCTFGIDEETAGKFTDGDLIEIEYDGSIAESYPAQITSVYGAKLIEDGEISDIDESVLSDLREMGWIE